MDDNVLDENEILTKANHLVIEGLRQAAILLLQQNLELHPHSTALLTALGHVYLLENQPTKALNHFNKSLKASQAANDFTDEDLEFINTQAEQSKEVDYSPHDDAVSDASDADSGKVQQLSPRPKLSLSSPRNTSQTERPAKHQVKIKYRQRKYLNTNNSTPRSRATGSLGEGSPATEPVIPKDQLQREATTFTTPNSRHVSSHTDNKEPDVQAVEQSLDDLYYEELQPNADFAVPENDDAAYSLFDYLPDSLDNQEIDEFAWDEYEDLDEFDEEANRGDAEHILPTDYVGRERRALQVATEVIANCDWHPCSIELLQKVFVENGWNATRVAIEREISKGMIPDELMLARAIRNYWFNNDRYWITFARIKSNALYMEATAAYCNISWVDALRVIRCFPAIPAVEEVITLIEDLYEWWYADQSLCRSFKTFLRFLQYRTGSVRGALSGESIFSFHGWADENIGSENITLCHYNTPARHCLQELGIKLPLSEPPPLKGMRKRKESEE